MSIDGGMDKEVVIYGMEYYSAINKNEIMPFAATWMDLEISGVYMLIPNSYFILPSNLSSLVIIVCF